MKNKSKSFLFYAYAYFLCILPTPLHRIANEYCQPTVSDSAGSAQQQAVRKRHEEWLARKVTIEATKSPHSSGQSLIS